MHYDEAAQRDQRGHSAAVEILASHALILNITISFGAMEEYASTIST